MLKSIFAYPAIGLVMIMLSGFPVHAAELVLGLSYGKTGYYATSARTTETAVDIAVREINAAGGVNGKKIRIVKYDTGGDPKQAQVAVRKLALDDKVLAIIGPFSSAEARVAFPAGERLKIVQIPNASSAPKLAKGKRYGYRFTVSEFVQFARLVKTLKSKGYASKTVSIVYASDEFVSKIVGTLLMPAVFRKMGVKIVGKPIGFPSDSFDLSPQVSKLMQNPTDLVAVGAIVPGALKVLTEMRRQGHKGRMIGSQLFADPDIAEQLGPKGDGTMHAAWFWWNRNEKTRAFTKAFDAENRRRGIKKAGPHHVDASAYDIVYVLKMAMEKAGITGDPSKLQQERDAIADTLITIKIDGVTGKACFDKNHDARLPAYIIEIKGKKRYLVDTHPTEGC